MSSLLSISLVETELLRKKLYENIIEWIMFRIRDSKLKYKDVCNLLLRYILNKNITKSNNDDPVFITTKSSNANSQISKDFIYFKISTNPTNFIIELEEKILSAQTILSSTQIKKDYPISLTNNKILYNNKYYTDISDLAKKYPDNISYALALNIRYNYLKLSTHGLAMNYEQIDPKDGCEAFASSFNNYFDCYYSAFPDLETPFGSLGSFFDVKEFPKNKIYVNPPFDESIMSQTMNKIKTFNKSNISFDCVFPDWKDYDELTEFKKLGNSIYYTKGELPFIDYMNNNKIIYPCNIVKILIH